MHLSNARESNSIFILGALKIPNGVHVLMKKATSIAIFTVLLTDIMHLLQWITIPLDYEISYVGEGWRPPPLITIRERPTGLHLLDSIRLIILITTWSEGTGWRQVDLIDGTLMTKPVPG